MNKKSLLNTASMGAGEEMSLAPQSDISDKKKKSELNDRYLE